MSMVVKGVLTTSLPWTLVFIGAFLAVCVEILGVSSLPFAVGLYLPVHLFDAHHGGRDRPHFYEKTRDAEARHECRERGVLFASGLIAGGALVGILVAVLVNAHLQERSTSGPTGPGEVPASCAPPRSWRSPRRSP